MANNKYTVMSEEAIRYICGLIKNIVSLPSEIISNTNLSDNLTFSNIHIKDLVDQCLIDAKDYVDLIYGSLIKLTCEKTTVQPTLDNSQINVIYLYSADGNAPFQQYLKISETELIDMGSTTISLTDYLTATQIASAYVKQIDFETLTTSFNNLVASVDKKIDKDKIVTVLDDTVTDEQVPSAKVVYEELDKKVEELKANFEVGVNTIYNSVVAKGVTPADKSPSSIVEAISKICIIKENIPLIPIMTSDTTPSGKALASSNANSSVFPYHSFDGTDKYWASKTSTNSWIRYDFDEDVCVNKISFKAISETEGTNKPRVKDFRFEISINGYDWLTLYTGTVAKDCTNTQTFEFDNKNFYKYYRVYIVDGYSGTVYNSLNYLQFYGYKSL